MDKMERILATLLGFLLVLGHRLAEGCQCMPAHPQDHFCRASFVIKASIMSKKPLVEPGRSMATHLLYQVKLDKVFKGEDNGLKAGDVVDIKTATMGSLCGNPDLAERKSYILTGNEYSGTLYHTSCNLATEWKQVTVFQRKGFRNFYRKGCGKCEIQQPFGYYYSSLPSARICTYSQLPGTEDCETKYSTCKQQSKGSCNWLASSAYDKCVLERDELDGGSGFLQ